MNNFLKRTWAEINLDAIKNNFIQIRKNISPNTKILCVIKADAYGHGAEILAAEYEALGADWFAVSNIEEAFQIRKVGIKKPILILGYTPVSMAPQLAKLNISQAVFSEEYAERLSNNASKNNVNVKIHIKVDTGMSRIGFLFQNINNHSHSIDTIEKVCNLKNIHAEGIFTHFARADEDGVAINATNLQYNNFIYIIKALKKRGIDIPISHCSNSGAILNYKEFNLDMVRAGIILYGVYPSEYSKSNLKLEPAMALKTVISQVKEVEPGTAVSYGSTYVTNKKTKIATVPIGYADGYFRSLSSKADMLIGGKRAPILGRICMDQTMLDVTGIRDVEVNKIVTVFGKDNGASITIDELAKKANTINYELLCAISKRVPRIYTKNGKNVGTLDYICPCLE